MVLLIRLSNSYNLGYKSSDFSFTRYNKKKFNTPDTEQYISMVTDKYCMYLVFL